MINLRIFRYFVICLGSSAYAPRPAASAATDSLAWWPSLLLPLLLGSLLLTACGGGGSAEGGPGHSHGGSGPVKAVVHLDSAQRRNAQLQLGAMRLDTFSREVPVNGHVKLPPQHRFDITTLAAGQVSSIEVIEGDRVQAGEALVHLRDPHYLELQQQYKSTLDRLDYLQAEFERKQALSKTNVAAKRKLEKARADYREAQTRQAALAERLRMLGLSPERATAGQFQQQITLTAPQAGFVDAVHVNTGSYVQANKPLLHLLNTDHIHIHLKVYEKDVAAVQKGQTVRFTVNGLPGRRFSAEIISVGRAMREDSRSVGIHARLHDPPPAMIAGMYVSGHVRAEAYHAPSLPAEAVVRQGGEQYVYVRTGQHAGHWTFRRRRVKTGARRAGRVEIRNPAALPADSSLVVSGAHALLGEQLKGAGHGHHH